MKHKKAIYGLPIAVFLCLMMLLAFTYKSYASYTGTDQKINEIQAGKLDIDVEEEINGLSKESVTIINTENVPCYIRAAVFYPEGIDGIVKKSGPNFSGSWKQSDGYYYYNEILNPKESVTLGTAGASFIEYEVDSSKIIPEQAAVYGDVIIHVEAVQAMEGINSAEDAFAKIN